MITDDDWRLQGQEKYMQALAFQWKPYTHYSKEWDHDHCEFCGAKFVETLEEPDALTDGFATADNYRWVCGTCFDDFKQRFRWTLIES